MKMRRVMLLLVPLFFLFLAGCSKSDSDNLQAKEAVSYQEKGVIFQHLKIPLTTIDPAYVHNESEIMMAKLIFQGLVKENKNGEVVSAIARDWEVSPDKLTYVFHLNKRILFHNGKEIKASDFKFSWERVLRLNAPSAYLFANIQGASDVLSGQQTLASGITALDDYTLQIKLIHPQSNFINLLTHPAGAVLDRYEVVEQGVNFAKPGTLSLPASIPSGNGPFQLIEWIDGRSITLGKNFAYAGEKPAIWRVVFTIREDINDAVLDFLAGNIQILQDLTYNNLAHLTGEYTTIKMVEKPLLQFRYVGINAQIKPFDNKALRDAVMFSLNRPQILKASRGKSGNVLQGSVTDYWYHQSVQEKAYNNYNKEVAMNMLALAGYPGGSNLQEITLTCGSSEEDQIIGKQIQDSLTSVGYKIKVQYLSQKDLIRAVKKGEVAFYTKKFTARSLELEDFFREQIDSKWQQTIVNPLWDQMLENAGQQDLNMRLNLYRQLENEVVQDSRIKFLYSYQSAAAISERVDNFQLGGGNNVLFDQILLKD